MVRFFLGAIFTIAFNFFVFSQTQLITNSGFNSNLSGWTTSGNVWQTNFYSNGTATFSGGNTAVTGIISQSFAVTSGQTLTVTLNYARRGNSSGFVGGLFEILNGGSVISSTTITTSATAGNFISTTFTIVAPSNNLSIRLTDQTANTNSRDLYVNTISITQPIPLPVTLLSFEGFQNENGDNILEWKTANEQNNDFFTIERSNDGLHWNEMEVVNGAGHSHSIKSYSYIDSDPINGMNYYRLAQTDFDGTREHFDVVQISNELKLDGLKITSYPNPTKDYVILEGAELSLDEVQVYDTKGLNVSSLLMISKVDEQKIKLNLAEQHSGGYVIRVEGRTVLKVIKR